MLSPEERRHFHRLERGLRFTDPDWLARHYPRRRRYADLARLVVAMLAAGLLSGGAVVSAMPVVFCGIVLGMGAATSLVSSRSTTRNVHEGDVGYRAAV